MMTKVFPKPRFVPLWFTRALTSHIHTDDCDCDVYMAGEATEEDDEGELT